MKPPNYIFIVGVGRSGTSLLQSMLGAHPQITVAPETHFLRHYVFESSSLIYDREALYQRLSKDEVFGRLKLDLADLLPSEVQTVNALEFFDRVAGHLNTDPGKIIFVEKDPNNIDHLAEIYTHFPEALVIHIYRDPRDVVLSKTRAAWSADRPYWLHAMIGEAQISAGIEVGRNRVPERYLEIKYEQLITEPAAVLRTVCSAAGVAYDAGMLQFQETAKGLVSDGERSWKKETYEPLKRNNKEKWRTQLSDKQVALIESLSPTYFEQLGYLQSAEKGSIGGSLLRMTGPLLNFSYRMARKFRKR